MTKYIVSVYDDTDEEYFVEKCFEQEFHKKEEAVNMFTTKAKEIISNMVSEGLMVSVLREAEWCEGMYTFKCTISGCKNGDVRGDTYISRTVWLNY